MGKRTSKRTPKRTPEKDWATVFLVELAKTGNVSKAVARTKIARSAVYKRRESDPAFAAAWAEAEEVAVELMEAEARRRAVEGTLRPVFQGGAMAGKVREYSDTLLIFLLKARRPAVYRENTRVVVAGDPAAPVKHDHTVSVTDRIDHLTRLFGGVPDPGEGGGAGDGAGEPLRPGADQGRADAETG